MAGEASARIYRPRAVIGDSGYFRVFLDGMDVGELWADQVRTFEVVPGQHQLRLMQFVVRRGSIAFSVEEGQVMELACSRLAVFGLLGLHPATPKESQGSANLTNTASGQHPGTLEGRMDAHNAESERHGHGPQRLVRS